jgi:hypothetical protein
MSLIPRALRPMTFLRRRAMRSGMRSDNEIVRLVALLIVGRPALVRQTAFRQGFTRRDGFWRSVAYVILVGDLVRRLTVKEPDRLGVETLVEGQRVTVSALPRPTRRQLRRAARAS